jgi:hypothetical protein
MNIEKPRPGTSVRLLFDRLLAGEAIKTREDGRNLTAVFNQLQDRYGVEYEQRTGLIGKKMKGVWVKDRLVLREELVEMEQPQ